MPEVRKPENSQLLNQQPVPQAVQNHNINSYPLMQASSASGLAASVSEMSAMPFA